eukprot:5179540-Pyramimonas_sp.AAC.1
MRKEVLTGARFFIAHGHATSRARESVAESFCRRPLNAYKLARVLRKSFRSITRARTCRLPDNQSFLCSQTSLGTVHARSSARSATAKIAAEQLKRSADLIKQRQALSTVKGTPHTGGERWVGDESVSGDDTLSPLGSPQSHRKQVGLHFLSRQKPPSHKTRRRLVARNGCG